MSEEKKYTLKDIEDAFLSADQAMISFMYLKHQLDKPPITFADGEVIAFERGSTLQHDLYETFNLDGSLTYCRKLTQTEVGPDWRPAAAVDDVDLFLDQVISAEIMAASEGHSYHEIHKVLFDAIERYREAIDPDKEA